MKKNNKLIIALGIILFVLVLIVIALLMKSKFDNEDSVDATDVVEVAPTVEQQIEEEEAYKVKTDYVNLYYPKKWKNQIEIEESDDSNTVLFYATIKDKDKQHLFDILFNSEEGYKIGTVEKDGKAVSVNLISYDLEFDSNWTEDEKLIVIAMQEDVNYIMGMLEKEDTFVKE